MQQGFHVREEAEGKEGPAESKSKMRSFRDLYHQENDEKRYFITKVRVAPSQSLAMEAQPNGGSQQGSQLSVHRLDSVGLSES